MPKRKLSKPALIKVGFLWVTYVPVGDNEVPTGEKTCNNERGMTTALLSESGWYIANRLPLAKGAPAEWWSGPFPSKERAIDVAAILQRK